jgi:hypothetical protein
MTTRLEDGIVGQFDEKDNFAILNNAACLKYGSRQIKDTVIRYGDFALDQYDYRLSDAINYVDHEYYSLVGRVLVEFSALEDLLDKIIIKLTSDRSDDSGLRLVAMFTFIQKFNYIVSAIMPFIEGGKKGNLRHIAKFIESCIEVRNLVAHAKWETLSYDGFVRCQTRTDKNGLIYFRYFEFTNDTLNGIIQDTDQVIEEFVLFISNDAMLRESLYDIIDEYLDED